MKTLRTQRGFTGVEALIILLVVGIIGFAGWKVYDAKKSSDKSYDNASKSDAAIVDKDALEKAKLTEFQSKDLGFTFSYPKDWGDAAIKDGAVVSPGKGNFKQVTFSKRTDVDINFVLDAFSSPLDGCPDPLMAAPHDAASTRASVVGWDKENLKRYFVDRISGEKKIYLYNKTPGDTGPGFKLVKTGGNVLVYEDINQTPYKVNEESCYGEPLTEATVNKANSYYTFTRFAANYSNAKVKGVNAQYDNNKEKSQTVIDQIVTTLNNLK